jgi:hypothetical protein
METLEESDAMIDGFESPVQSMTLRSDGAVSDTAQ